MDTLKNIVQKPKLVSDVLRGSSSAGRREEMVNFAEIITAARYCNLAELEIAKPGTAVKKILSNSIEDFEIIAMFDGVETNDFQVHLPNDAPAGVRERISSLLRRRDAFFNPHSAASTVTRFPPPQGATGASTLKGGSNGLIVNKYLQRDASGRTTEKKQNESDQKFFYAILIRNINDQRCDINHPLKLAGAMEKIFGKVAGCYKLPSNDVLVSFHSQAEAAEALNKQNEALFLGDNCMLEKWHDAKRTFAIYGYHTSVTEKEFTDYMTKESKLNVKIVKVLSPTSKRSTIFVEALNKDTYFSLMNTRTIKVGFERYSIAKVRKKKIKQCRRCYGFDHTAKTCSQESICRHCSACHKEDDCPEKSKKCKNCSGSHSADSR
ncbi:hypothetical protein MHBO_003703, partial [Bonamia ostreae]